MQIKIASPNSDVEFSLREGSENLQVGTFPTDKKRQIEEKLLFT